MLIDIWIPKYRKRVLLHIPSESGQSFRGKPASHSDAGSGNLFTAGLGNLLTVLLGFFLTAILWGKVLDVYKLPFSKWEVIFKDPMVAAAAIDRLVHHSVILELNIASYRMLAAKKKIAEAAA